MGELSNIFGLPQNIDDIGDIYPIRLNKYEEFMECAQLLRLTKKHFNESDEDNLPFFDLIIIQGMRTNSLENFIHMIYLVTGCVFDLKINPISGSFMLIGSGSRFIDNSNFEKFRSVVMKQNLLYEDRVFKNPMVKQWADKVLKARSRNSVDMSLEDIVGVVHIRTGVPLEKIATYTLYQLQYVFQRVIKYEDYRDSIYLAPHSEKNNIKPFMEKIELYKNPYDDVFVDKGKLNNLNKAIGYSE